MPTAFTRKQPRGVRPTRQDRQVVMHVFCDESRQRLPKKKFERHPIFHVVLGKPQPIGRFGCVGPREIFSKPNTD